MQINQERIVTYEERRSSVKVYEIEPGEHREILSWLPLQYTRPKLKDSKITIFIEDPKSRADGINSMKSSEKCYKPKDLGEEDSRTPASKQVIQPLESSSRNKKMHVYRSFSDKRLQISLSHRGVDGFKSIGCVLQDLDPTSRRHIGLLVRHIGPWHSFGTFRWINGKYGKRYC